MLRDGGHHMIEQLFNNANHANPVTWKASFIFLGADFRKCERLRVRKFGQECGANVFDGIESSWLKSSWKQIREGGGRKATNMRGVINNDVELAAGNRDAAIQRCRIILASPNEMNAPIGRKVLWPFLDV